MTCPTSRCWRRSTACCSISGISRLYLPLRPISPKSQEKQSGGKNVRIITSQSATQTSTSQTFWKNNPYIYDKDSKIYYNKENYNKPNKTIIGRLILNEGQPCYNSTEKLWRQFSSEEGFKTHLKCEFEVFGKYNDDRYEERGSITYKRLYLDNLN